MEQGNRLDSTSVSARHEARDGSADEPALNMAITALLARPEAKAPVSHLGEMVAEWSAMLQRENGGGIEAEEAEKHAPKRIALQLAILTTPVTTLSDLAAKIPLFRDELESVTPQDQGLETLPVAAWKAVVRDIGVLAHPQPVAQATMMDTDTGQPIEDLATACVEQIARLEQWDANPGSISEEQGNEEMDRWGAVFRRAIHEPSNSLRDLAGKAYLMLADLDRFEPEKADDKDNDRLMRVILREAIAMGGLVYPASARQGEAVVKRDGGDAPPPPHSADTGGRPTEPVDQHAVIRAIQRHREAKQVLDTATLAADEVQIRNDGGDTSEAALEPLNATWSAASDAYDQAYRDLIATRPQDLPDLLTLLRHLAEHADGHRGMEDEPDVFGALIGAVEGMRLTESAPAAGHDLSRLSIGELEALARIARREQEVLMDTGSMYASARPSFTRLMDIFEAEGERFSLLSDLAVNETARRRPSGKDDTDRRLEAMVRHHLNCNGYIEPALMAEINAAWGAR